NVAETTAGNQGAMAAITASLRNLGDAAEALPLIDMPVRNIHEVTDSLEDFRVNLYTTLKSLTPENAGNEVSQALFNVLGPGGANVLADKDGSGTLTPDDVNVDVHGLSGVDVSLDLGKSVTFDSKMGLGID